MASQEGADGHGDLSAAEDGAEVCSSRRSAGASSSRGRDEWQHHRLHEAVPGHGGRQVLSCKRRGRAGSAGGTSQDGMEVALRAVCLPSEAGQSADQAGGIGVATVQLSVAGESLADFSRPAGHVTDRRLSQPHVAY
eukprot:749208-Hanusia_phi.AAC.2